MSKSKWYKTAFGYGASFVAEYNFKPTLFLQSGVGIENIAYDDNFDINNVFYAQLPIHIGYRYIFDNGKACFIQAGPTFGIGLHGHLHCIGCGSEDCNYFDEARRFDLGLGGRVGVELNKFKISVGANYGVLKVFPKDKYHNFIVNLGVAYMF